MEKVKMKNWTQINAQIYLKRCQKDQEPYVFWNLKEFDMVEGINLPIIKKVPKNWLYHGVPITVDLEKTKQVESARKVMRKKIQNFEKSNTEIGFAISRKNNNLITIQTFIQQP